MLRRKNIQVISVNEPIEDTPAGKLLEGIIEVIDEFYSDNLAQDVVRGMKESASRGFFCGGTVPYGYRRVKVQDGAVSRTKLEPDEATTPVVRRIFAECLAGKGGVDIAKGLNGDGIPGPTGRPWLKNAIYQVLTNEAATGTLVWGKRARPREGLPVRVEGAWESIVDEDTFLRAKRTVASRGPRIVRPRSVASKYLLSGIVRCSECGSGMVGAAAKSGRFLYYRCGTALRRGASACSSGWLPKDKIEAFVINRLRQYILTDDNLRELAELVREEVRALTQDQQERLTLLDGQIGEAEQRLERLYDAVETGKLSLDELAPRIRTLRERIAELTEARRLAAHAQQEKETEIDEIELSRRYLDDLRSVLGSAPLVEQKGFLKSFVKSIEVSGSEVTINYTVPMPPLYADSETVGVLDFDLSLGRAGLEPATP